MRVYILHGEYDYPEGGTHKFIEVFSSIEKLDAWADAHTSHQDISHGPNVRKIEVTIHEVDPSTIIFRKEKP